MHADKHQSFYKLAFSFLMETARHVQRIQNRKLVIFFQYIKKKALQLLLCSIVIENIQIFYGGPVMFVVTCFQVVVVKNGSCLLDHHSKILCIYIYIYIHIYNIYIYTYIYIYICNHYNHENNVPSRGSSCTCAHDVGHTMNRTSCVQLHELLQSHCGDNRESTLFLWLHIHYAHLASVKF